MVVDIIDGCATNSIESTIECFGKVIYHGTSYIMVKMRYDIMLHTQSTLLYYKGMEYRVSAIKNDCKNFMTVKCVPTNH